MKKAERKKNRFFEQQSQRFRIESTKKKLK